MLKPSFATLGAVTVCVLMVGCGAEVQRDYYWKGEQTGPYTYSAPNSVAPDGLDKISHGMKAPEVVERLASKYEFNPPTWRNPTRPSIDYFSYMENGQKKLIEVWYGDGEVDFVRYGFTEALRIQ